MIIILSSYAFVSYSTFSSLRLFGSIFTVLGLHIVLEEIWMQNIGLFLISLDVVLDCR